MHIEIYHKSNLTELSAKHRAQVILLDRDLDDQCWSQKTWLESWEDFGFFILQIALIDDDVVGFGLWTLPPVDDVMHLLKIVVKAELRGEGLAGKIFAQMLAQNSNKGVFLEVRSDNSHAVALYQKLGLRIMTKTKNYYGSGIDAYKMFKAALPNE